jgi:hypothetical protein
LESGENNEQSNLHSEISPSIDPQALMDAGWYQGVVFDIDAAYEGLGVGSYIVLNQSCDLLYHCLSSEPLLEVLKVEKLELDSVKNYKSLMHGKSTRGLIFECENSFFWSAPSLIYRETLNRKSLEGLSPRTKVKDLRNFSSWLGRRYDRVAFPDNFNNLFPNARKCDAEKAYKQFEKFVKQFDSEISEVWIKLSSWEELSPELKYSIGIVLLLNNSGESQKEEISVLFEDLMEGVREAKVKDGVVKLEGIRGCLKGIEIEEYHVLERHEFTRAEIEIYSLFNLDYISHSSGNDLPGYR